MALQENLTKENLEDLKKTFNEKIAPENPEAAFKSFNMDAIEDALKKGKSENEMLISISYQLDCIENLIKKIFGDHVLIDGQFVDIKKEV